MTRVLAYAVNLAVVRAVDVSAKTTTDIELCSTRDLLDEVDALMSELNTPALLSRPICPELERFASEWGRKLLPPAWLADPPETCVLVPHTFLHGLPLHLIRTNSGDPLCVASAVSVTSSLTALRHALQRSAWATDLADQFIAVRRKEAERRYAKADRRHAKAERRYGESGPRLDRSAAGYLSTGSRWLAAGVDALGANDDAWRTLPAELVKICAPESDQSIIESADQSLRTVLANRLVGQEYDLVVLAAHGHRNPLDALDGGIVLRSSPEPRGLVLKPVFGRESDTDNVPFLFQDLPQRDLAPELSPSQPAELLSVAELEDKRVHLVCPLVVLLGCSTGRPVIHPGDQPQSLAEMFLRMGAAAVVAPMWDVRISVVREWATAFLEKLGERTDRGRGAAARDASRALHERGAPLQDVACMVLHGDYR